MLGEPRNLWNDESGAALLEFTAAAFTFFIVLFGTFEFSQVYFQWNAASKATQYGARLAAVSDPVAANLSTLTGTETGALPGTTMPNYDCICKFTSGSLACTGTVPSGATVCGIGTTGASAMNIVTAANALGYVASWLTGWAAFDRGVLDQLGLRPEEKMAGFIHIGRPTRPSEDRDRPALSDIVTRFS